MSLRALWVTVSLLAPLSPAWAAPITAFYFTSSPTSFIGQGETFQTSSLDPLAHFYVLPSDPAGVRLTVVEDDPPPTSSLGRSWDLTFVAKNGQPLVAGHYSPASLAGFQPANYAGLDFHGESRANSSVLGFFDVRDISYNPSGALVSLAVDFTQYEFGDTTRYDIGSIRINSEIPLTVPEPAVTLLLTAAAACGVAARAPR